MITLFLELEKQIAQTFGYVWAIRFEDILKVIAGFILGACFVIYQVARLFLNLKRKNKLEDGEVIFLKAKEHIETWANARTIAGSFYAVFCMVIFRFMFMRRQHFLQSQRSIHIFSIAVLVFCTIVLYITTVYTMTVFVDDPSSGVCQTTSANIHNAFQHAPK